MDGGTWWATVHGVAKSRTRLSDFTFTFSLCTQAAEHDWPQALERASRVVLVAKNPPAKAGDRRDGGSVPGSERCPGGRDGGVGAWEWGVKCWMASLSTLRGCCGPLEKGMATHSSVLAWRIPRTAEPGGLWSTGLQRVGHD